jgi:hypothetical protein
MFVATSCATTFTQPGKHALQSRPKRAWVPPAVILSALLLSPGTASSASECVVVDLKSEATGQPTLYWVDSAVWLKDPLGPKLLALDVLTDAPQWLELAPNLVAPTRGHRFPDPLTSLRGAGVQAPRLLRPKPDGPGFYLLADEVGYPTDQNPSPTPVIVELDAQLRRTPTTRPVWRQNMDLTLPAPTTHTGATRVTPTYVRDFVVTAGGILAFGDLEGPKPDATSDDFSSVWFTTLPTPGRDSRTTILQPQLAIQPGPGVETLRRFYTSVTSYLAATKTIAFFLDLTGDRPGFRSYLFNPRTGLVQESGTTAFQHIGGKLELTSLQGTRAPATLTQLYRELQRRAIAVSIHAWGEKLYALAKSEMDPWNNRTTWTLHRIDPTSGRSLAAVVLPASKPHLVLAPGEQWAIFEKSRVYGVGPSDFPSFETSTLLLLNDSALQRALAESERASTQDLRPTSLRDVCF